jgi:hypothetical protein
MRRHTCCSASLLTAFTSPRFGFPPVVLGEWVGQMVRCAPRRQGCRGVGDGCVREVSTREREGVVADDAVSLDRSAAAANGIGVPRWQRSGQSHRRRVRHIASPSIDTLRLFVPEEERAAHEPVARRDGRIGSCRTSRRPGPRRLSPSALATFRFFPATLHNGLCGSFHEPDCAISGSGNRIPRKHSTHGTSYKVAEHQVWRSPQDVRTTFRTADRRRSAEWPGSVQHP